MTPTGPNNFQNTGSDPLLSPGSFIDPISYSSFHPTGSSNRCTSTMASSRSTPKRKQGGHGAAPVSPQPLNQVPLDQGPAPDWLPHGWRMEMKVRVGGATAGTKDKYYIENATGQRCRSKNEVLQYLEFGSTKKRKIKPDGDASGSPGQSHSSKKKMSATPPRPSIEDFKFKDVPEKVRWIVADALADKWKPIVGDDEQVPQNSLAVWEFAFDYLSSKENGAT